MQAHECHSQREQQQQRTLPFCLHVKVAPDLHARQCGGSKAHCLSAHLLPAQSFAINPNMTWEKIHLENGRSLEPNPIQVHLELGSILGGKASLFQMKICAPEKYIRLNNQGKGNPQLSSEIRVKEREREREIKRIYHTRDVVDTLPNNCKSLYFSTRRIHIPPLQCNAMQPVSASLVLEHPLHSDFIPHAPLKKKAAAAIVSGTYLIVHNVKRTRSKLQESAKTRKTQSLKHTHTHTREPRVYFYNASKNTASLHPTPNEEEQKKSKNTEKLSVHQRTVGHGIARPDRQCNNRTRQQKNRTEQNKQTNKCNKTNPETQQSQNHDNSDAQLLYYCRFNTAFLGPKNKSTNQAIKQEKVRPAKCFETTCCSSSSPEERKGKQANDTPHPFRPQNKKQNKKTIKSEQKNGRQTKRKRTK